MMLMHVVHQEKALNIFNFNKPQRRLLIVCLYIDVYTVQPITA